MTNEQERNELYNNIINGIDALKNNNNKDFDELNNRIGYLEKQNGVLICQLEIMLNSLKQCR